MTSITPDPADAVWIGTFGTIYPRRERRHPERHRRGRARAGGPISARECRAELRGHGWVLRYMEHPTVAVGRIQSYDVNGPSSSPARSPLRTLVDTREHLDNGNFLHSEMQSNFSATGTGSVTGASYTIHDVSHESFDSPSVPAPQFNASFHETFHVTSSNPDLGFSSQLVHVLNSPATGFKVTRDTESATCHG